MTTSTKPRHARRSMLWPLTADKLLPRDLTDIPDPIIEANKAAHGAYAEYERARAKAGELGEQAKAAPRFDQLAAEAALAAGENPPEPTVGPKEANAQEARRVAEAAERVAKMKVRDLYDAIEDHLDEYVESRRVPVVEAAVGLRDLIPEVINRLDAAQLDQALYVAAQQFHNNPGSATLGTPSGRRRGGLRPGYEKAEAELRKRQGIRRVTQVPNDLPHLLAALALKLEAEVG